MFDKTDPEKKTPESDTLLIATGYHRADRAFQNYFPTCHHFQTDQWDQLLIALEKKTEIRLSTTQLTVTVTLVL